MDKRILKTKKCLKDSLIELTKEKSFEKITVKEICDRANTGRGTFYTYYNDKLDLLQDCFVDTQNTIMERFHEETLGKNLDLRDSIIVLFDIILDLQDAFDMADKLITSGYEMLLLYYNFVLNSLDTFEDEVLGKHIKTKYDRRQLNSFLVLGFYGFLHSIPGQDRADLKENLYLLITDLSESGIFKQA